MRMFESSQNTLSSRLGTMRQLVAAGFTAGALMIVVACSGGLQQDPYANAPDKIKNAQLPDTPEPAAAKPVAADALRIDALDFYTFKEGTAGEITFSGRVLMPINGHSIGVMNQDFELAIDNLSEFPGATFDKATAKFTWTPPMQYAGTDFQRNARLEVVLTTKGSGPVLATHKTIPLFVARSAIDPEVVSVDNLMMVPTREGEKRKFTVTVKDPDSLDLQDARPRMLVVSNASRMGLLNAAHMVYVADVGWNESNPVQDPNDKSKWTFTMWLDTTGKELTHKQETFNFALVAVSRFGKNSAPKAVEASIITSVLTPVMSWPDNSTLTVFKGQENNLNFTVYDPQGEGKVDVTFNRCDRLPGSPACSCVAQGIDGNQLCTVSWKVPANATTSDYTVDGEIINRSKVPGDIAYTKTQFSRKIRVMPNPNAPSPGPTTTFTGSSGMPAAPSSPGIHMDPAPPAPPAPAENEHSNVQPSNSSPIQFPGEMP